jgi:iron complex outermembrane receptor protein
MTSYLSRKNHSFNLRRASKLALAINLALVSQLSMAQQADSTAGAEKTEVITITGSRIARTELVASSPVASVDEVQIQLDRAVNVEDITAKLPQTTALKLPMQ